MATHGGWARGERLCVPVPATPGRLQRETRKQHGKRQDGGKHGEACGHGVDDKKHRHETTIPALHAIDGGLACTGRPRTTTLCLSGSNPVAMRPSPEWRCSIMPPIRACDTGTCAAPLLLLPPPTGGGPTSRTAASTSACLGSRPAGTAWCASSLALPAISTHWEPCGPLGVGSFFGSFFFPFAMDAEARGRGP